MANLPSLKSFGNLSHFNPFSSDWDEFFRPAFGNFLRQMDGQLIPLDISEDDKAFKVRAQVPGVKKEDIKVSVDGAQVSIRAESKQEKEEKKDDKVVVRECFCGSQYRSFTLPQGVDAAKATAKYADGVLELALPKTGPATASTVSIS